jgi:hypothetical protein
MHKSSTKCNETIGKWYKNKHGASKIIDMFETYQQPHRKLGTKYLVVLCAGSTLLLAEDALTHFVVKRRPCWSVTRLSSITFSHLFAPLLINIPWFLNWGKILLLYSSHLPLGVPNGLVIQLGSNSFLAPSTNNQHVWLLRKHLYWPNGPNIASLVTCEFGYACMYHTQSTPETFT